MIAQHGKMTCNPLKLSSYCLSCCESNIVSWGSNSGLEDDYSQRPYYDDLVRAGLTAITIFKGQRWMLWDRFSLWFDSPPFLHADVHKRVEV